MVEGLLTLWTPVEDRISPGEDVEGGGNGGEVYDIKPVVPGEALKRADFCCILGGFLSLGWPSIGWDQGGGLLK